MRCPNCKQGELKYTQLEENLPCQTCTNCGGHWLLLVDYLSWQSANRSKKLEAPSITINESEDTTKALICPVSGKLMTKYRISSKTDHKVDLSSSVNAIWLDKEEWNLLKQEELSLQLNHIFTEPYQKNIREELASKSFERVYQQQFGEEGYSKIKAFKEWLDTQDKRAEILAYLIADNPYDRVR